MIQRRKDYQKKYAEEHREEACQRTKEYRQAHKEEVKEAQNRWRQEHIERARELKRESQARNWVKNLERNALNAHRRRAKIRGAEGEGLTLSQWRQMCKECGNRCSYCGSKEKMTVDHVIPLSRGGKHDVSNIVPACKPCNIKKNNKSLLWFLYVRYTYDSY